MRQSSRVLHMPPHVIISTEHVMCSAVSMRNGCNLSAHLDGAATAKLVPTDACFADDLLSLLHREDVIRPIPITGIL